MIVNDSHVEGGQPTGEADMLASLVAVPETLRRMIGERSSDDLRKPGHDGGHAAVEVLCHLQDWDEITGERVWRMLHEESPELESFDDSFWSIEHDYLLRDGLAALEAFAISRANLVGMLAGADDETWNRTAELQGHGTITLREMVDQRVSYDAGHITELGEALR
jgi:hypothetical protein